MLAENNLPKLQKYYLRIKLDLSDVFVGYILERFWKSIRKLIEIL